MAEEQGFSINAWASINNFQFAIDAYFRLWLKTTSAAFVWTNPAKHFLQFGLAWLKVVQCQIPVNSFMPHCH